jgi:hypothetical protein
MKDVILSIQGVIDMPRGTAGVTPNVFYACII